MARTPSYSDSDLADAVRSSRSWREVLRRLRLAQSSGASMASVRARSSRNGLDFSHFVGQRRWTDEDLRVAVKRESSWTDVVRALEIEGGSSIPTVQGHSARLGLNTSHLAPRRGTRPFDRLLPDAVYLNRAGPMLAAAWFSLCGCEVSWPLEPCRYDLLITKDSNVRRVQVKTSTTRAGASWKVYLSTTRSGRRPYSPDEIDDFFVIDGELNHYLIPFAAVGGLHAIHLRSYRQYLVPVFPAPDPDPEGSS